MTLEAGGRVDDDGLVHCFGRTLRAQAFPIGIDTANVAATARSHDRGDLTNRLKANLGERKLIIGVDRLDYSKGLVERFTAFERLLETFPDEHRGVVR